MGILTEKRTWQQQAADLAHTLTLIKQDQHRAGDACSWDAARRYVTAYERISATYQQAAGKKLTPQIINKEIRRQPGYAGYCPSWLSDAKRLEGMWPELFQVNLKKLPYDHYVRIATCGLKAPRAKERLRKWAEENRPTQAALRAEVRCRVEAEKGIYRPDFDFKTSNCWRFSDQTVPAEFEGGIHPELVANLLYYYTAPGAVVVDPMAGGDVVYRVTQRYRFFQERSDQMAGSGPRTVLRSDIEPRWEGVIEADVRQCLPFAESSADFCLLDPPYLKTPKDMYRLFGETIEEWTANLAAAVEQIRRVLRAGGMLAVIADDYLRSKERHPLAAYAFRICSSAGFDPCGTIYNTFPNFVTTMGPIEMARCKRAGLMVNQMKIIHVFERESD